MRVNTIRTFRQILRPRVLRKQPKLTCVGLPSPVSAKVDSSIIKYVLFRTFLFESFLLTQGKSFQSNWVSKFSKVGSELEPNALFNPF